MRVASTLACCDREAISWVAPTGGITGEHIRDLMVESVERRFGLADRSPEGVEWPSDNGSPYVAVQTRALARDIGLAPCTTPIESPRSNGMAEALVKTFERDHAAISHRPDAVTVLARLPARFADYDDSHPHKALGYRSPREFIRASLRTSP